MINWEVHHRALVRRLVEIADNADAGKGDGYGMFMVVTRAHQKTIELWCKNDPVSKETLLAAEGAG